MISFEPKPQRCEMRFTGKRDSDNSRRAASSLSRISFDAIPVGEVADHAEWTAVEVGAVDVTPRPARQENAAVAAQDERRLEAFLHATEAGFDELADVFDGDKLLQHVWCSAPRQNAARCV